jgi:hypothetical protein
MRFFLMLWWRSCAYPPTFSWIHGLGGLNRRDELYDLWPSGQHSILLLKQNNHWWDIGESDEKSRTWVTDSGFNLLTQGIDCSLKGFPEFPGQWSCPSNTFWSKWAQSQPPSIRIVHREADSQKERKNQWQTHREAHTFNSPTPKNKENIENWKDVSIITDWPTNEPNRSSDHVHIHETHSTATYVGSKTYERAKGARTPKPPIKWNLNWQVKTNDTCKTGIRYLESAL